MKSQTFVESDQAIALASKQLSWKAKLAGEIAGAKFERARQDSLYVLAGPLPKPIPVRDSHNHFTGEKRVTFGSW